MINTEKYKNIRTVFLIASFIVGVIGVFLNVAHSENGLSSFAYYTIQSNIVCIAACFFYIIQSFSKEKVEGYRLSLINGGAVMCIMLTFLVYHFLLAPTIDSGSAMIGPGNIYVHYIFPLLILADYIIFQKKGMFSYRMVWKWTLLPIAYCIFAFTYSYFGGRFGFNRHLVPYFFLDYIRFGYTGVALWVLVIAFGYICLSMLLVVLDKVLFQLTGKKE